MVILEVVFIEKWQLICLKEAMIREVVIMKCKHRSTNEQIKKRAISSKNALLFFLLVTLTYFSKLFVQMNFVALSSTIVMAFQIPRAILCLTAVSSL